MRTIEAEIEDLLAGLFTAQQLRRFLLRHTELRAVADELSESHPLAHAAHIAAHELRRRGLASPELFAVLIDERPARRSDIDAVASLLRPPNGETDCVLARTADQAPLQSELTATTEVDLHRLFDRRAKPVYGALLLRFLCGGSVPFHVLGVRNEIVIGRDQDADVVVHQAGVSRKHCAVRVTAAGNIELEDLGSTNGTFLDGHRVSVASISPGDLVRLTPSVCFRVLARAPAEASFAESLAGACGAPGGYDPETGLIAADRVTDELLGVLQLDEQYDSNFIAALGTEVVRPSAGPDPRRAEEAVTSIMDAIRRAMIGVDLALRHENQRIALFLPGRPLVDVLGMVSSIRAVVRYRLPVGIAQRRKLEPFLQWSARADRALETALLSELPRVWVEH